LLSIHPIIQLSATCLGLFVFYLGVQRFRSLHLKQKVKFNWKRHVLLGKIVMATWLAGILGGVSVVYMTWHGFLVTGIHGKVALVILPLILFGLFSGLHMNRKKKKRTFLPFVHGLINLTILVLALYQISTGWWVYNVYVLGN
jgi:uncharacterized membrane protein YozB (DUF420 family)